MKKKITLSVLLSALGILFSTACKKNSTDSDPVGVRTCTCTNGYSFTMASAKRSDQIKACDAAAIALGTTCTVQ
jgi:hypothetical protein